MKKTLTLILACLMVLALAAGCGSAGSTPAPEETEVPEVQETEAPEAQETEAPETQETEAPEAQETEAPEAQEAEAADPDDLRTMADVLGYNCYGSAFTTSTYVYVFEMGGTYYRAIAVMPEEVSNAVWSLSFRDPDYDAQLGETIAPLEITTLENLSEQIPSQEELDALVGMTGQELRDDSWTIRGWDLDRLEFTMDHGPFSYIVQCEGELELSEDHEFDEEADFAPLVVSAVTFSGIGSGAMDIE